MYFTDTIIPSIIPAQLKGFWWLPVQPTSTPAPAAQPQPQASKIPRQLLTQLEALRPILAKRGFLQYRSDRGIWRIRYNDKTKDGNAIFYGYDVTRPASFRARATRVHPGDTKAQVIAVLGKPNGTISTTAPNIVLPVPERWFYGSMFDWKHPFSSEFLKIVQISPEPGDVAVDFDQFGRVENVNIP